jgi:hypothetical protein
LTFILSNGLQIRIPNNQLITPFIDVDRNGSRLVHQDRRELLVASVIDNPTTLGRYFFTAAYLMVDHDAHTFTMWQANPSTKSNLVPVISKSADNEESACGGDGGAGGTGGSTGGDSTGSTGGTTNGADSADERANGSSSPSTGAIVGAAVGGVAALGALAILVFGLVRRKKKRAMIASSLPTSETSELKPQAGGTAELYNNPDKPGPWEAPVPPYSHCELHGMSAVNHEQGHWSWTNRRTLGQSDMVYELGSTEMPPK